MNEKILTKFTEICLKRLQTIEHIIMKIELKEDDKEDIILLMRELHNLKGESRILKLIEMSDVVHVLEDAILWKNNHDKTAPVDFFNLLYSGLDIIKILCQNGLSSPSEENLTLARNYKKEISFWLQDPDEKIPILYTKDIRINLDRDSIAAETTFDTDQIQLQKFGDLFQRFPRPIRDLAQKQGKQVKVLLEGTDIMMDNMIIDSLFTPLIHLIRNSIDHGIETPDIRTSSGKSEKALIKLSATQSEDSVMIRFSDDGAGIDTKKIKETLLHKKLLLPDEINSLTEQQLIQQLFQFGFSTKTTVDHLSGRGIGLDVVKATVEKLGGSILVESEIGKGTIFTIKIPSSLIS